MKLVAMISVLAMALLVGLSAIAEKDRQKQIVQEKQRKE